MGRGYGKPGEQPVSAQEWQSQGREVPIPEHDCPGAGCALCRQAPYVDTSK